MSVIPFASEGQNADQLGGGVRRTEGRYFTLDITVTCSVTPHYTKGEGGWFASYQHHDDMVKRELKTEICSSASMTVMRGGVGRTALRIVTDGSGE